MKSKHIAIKYPMSKFLSAAVMGMGLLACAARAEAYAVEYKKLPTEAWSAVIPAEKNLDPAWVKSLTERGKPKEYTGDALNAGVK